MAKTILQSVKFAASPKVLFEIYMDSKKHSAATGAQARLSRKYGGRFSAYDRHITGRNLLIIPPYLILQTWRGKDFKKNDPDSILILTFNKIRQGTRLGLVHVNVPDHEYRCIQEGWHRYYWKPWKKYLNKKLKIRNF
jgi:activator of HSP90 ATPase